MAHIVWCMAALIFSCESIVLPKYMFESDNLIIKKLLLRLRNGKGETKNENVTKVGLAAVPDPYNAPNTLLVQFPDQMFPMPLQLVGTDVNRYVVLYSCKDAAFFKEG